jgi:peptidoglycan/xylan/chitin deacetylase (PgdA/CDA1 family)|tara:strand:- start:74 stop:913 length:840 start_codon:yes stop_codon:yes gene_type:complete
MSVSKKIIIIWDFDGPIGQINATYPYNFNFDNFGEEINNVNYLLGFLEKKNIKTCFAITGFSAEKGVFPYNFPYLIRKISTDGHEVASHSWRHEWAPVFRKDQIKRSLKRSKEVLEKAIYPNKVVGFVPPHNRPMSWIKRGAFSLGDRGLYPFFKTGDMTTVLKLLKTNDYKWIRVSYKNLFQKLGFSKRILTGRVKKFNNLVVLENHYNGFDQLVINEILNSNREHYIVSAHPLMLSRPYKVESKENFEKFIDQILNSNQDIQFILPKDIINKSVFNK